MPTQKPSDVHKRAMVNLCILAVGMVVAGAMLVYGADVAASGMWLYMALLLVWWCIPFLLVGWFVIWQRRNQKVFDIVTLLTALLATSSIGLAVNGIIVHNDAFSALGFWALPFVQLATAGVLLSYAHFIR